MTTGFLQRMELAYFLPSRTNREAKSIRLRGWDAPGLIDRGISEVESISYENK